MKTVYVIRGDGGYATRWQLDYDDLPLEVTRFHRLPQNTRLVRFRLVSFGQHNLTRDAVMAAVWCQDRWWTLVTSVNNIAYHPVFERDDMQRPVSGVFYLAPWSGEQKIVHEVAAKVHSLPDGEFDVAMMVLREGVPVVAPKAVSVLSGSAASRPTPRPRQKGRS